MTIMKKFKILAEFIKDISCETKDEDKKDLQKIILCDVQKEIQPNLEKTFTNLLNNSGFNEVNINKIDFDKLYNERFN